MILGIIGLSMNPNFESIPENSPPPRIGVIEENPASHKTVERPLKTLADSSVKNPENMSPSERGDAFKRAYDFIVGNRDLERLVVKGFLSEKNVMPYAELMNTITEACISLSDVEIDNIIRKFKEGLRSRAVSYADEFGLSGKQLENLQTGMWNDRDPKSALNPGGIKAAAHFVRARKKLHESEPSTIPAFYFENHLDASHKIDLIEVIEREDGIVLNLIQIKSYEYEEQQIEENTEAHRDWVDGFVIDLMAYERNFSEEPDDSERMREFLTNVQVVQDVFLDILTGQQNISKQLLFEKLGFGNRPKVEQVWILNEYLPAVIKVVDGLKIEGVIGDAEYLIIMPIFDEMRKQLDAVRNQKKDLTGVAEVHSICAVNEKVVSDKVIFKAEGEKRKSMKIQH